MFPVQSCIQRAIPARLATQSLAVLHVQRDQDERLVLRAEAYRLRRTDELLGQDGLATREFQLTADRSIHRWPGDTMQRTKPKE